MKSWFKLPGVVSIDVGPSIFDGHLLPLTIKAQGWGWLRVSSSQRTSKVLRVLRALFWPLFGDVGKAVDRFTAKVFLPKGEHQVTILVPCKAVLRISMFNVFWVSMSRLVVPVRTGRFNMLKHSVPRIKSMRPKISGFPKPIYPRISAIQRSANGDGTFPISPTIKNIRCAEHISVFSFQEKDGSQ